ncbi:MAG TPA: helix-turn-helix domain-containing protein, partial [Longimicrobiales bacterium]|nr:helix-turn-helix domain-containing protein [Longimicrobiales bacterium]
MSGKEAARPGILKALSDGKITAQQAADALRVSLRHVHRLAARYRQAGAAGLIHRGRGQPSPRRLAEATRLEIAELMATKYRDFN